MKVKVNMNVHGKGKGEGTGNENGQIRRSSGTSIDPGRVDEDEDEAVGVVRRVEATLLVDLQRLVELSDSL